MISGKRGEWNYSTDGHQPNQDLLFLFSLVTQMFLFKVTVSPLHLGVIDNNKMKVTS